MVSFVGTVLFCGVTDHACAEYYNIGRENAFCRRHSESLGLFKKKSKKTEKNT